MRRRNAEGKEGERGWKIKWGERGGERRWYEQVQPKR